MFTLQYPVVNEGPLTFLNRGVEVAVFWYNTGTPTAFVEEMRRQKLKVRAACLPDRLQEEVLRDLHQDAVGGHIGEEKMINTLKERIY